MRPNLWREFKNLTLSILVVLILALLCFVGWRFLSSIVTGNYTSVSYAKGCIAFIRNCDLYTISVDGKNLRRLTKTSLRETSAQFSPIGDKLCFTRQTPGQRYDYDEIWICDRAGGNEKRLVPGKEHFLNTNIVFSENGRRILYRRWDTERGTGTICEITLDGLRVKEHQIDLAHLRYYSARHFFTGFASDKMGSAIWKVDTITAEKRCLIKLPIWVDHVMYSVDGRDIYIFGYRDSETKRSKQSSRSVYVFNLESKEYRPVDLALVSSVDPIFTEDGLSIVFAQGWSANQYIKIMNSDGTDVRNIIQI